MRTSVGFHTFTIFRTLQADVMKKLFRDFTSYSENTHRIRIYPIDDSKKSYRIEYPHDSDSIRGISWKIRFYTGFTEYKSYVIEATINPKIMTGMADYITAADESCIIEMEREFNTEAERISPLLVHFSQYKCNRIDYCVNFDIDELGINCTTSQLMQLLQRSNIPHYFTEREVYDPTSHRMKTSNDSFYLRSKSVNINCYNKYAQLLNEFPNSPSLSDSRNIIRFEIQCGYLKAYALSGKYNIYGNNLRDVLMALLSNETAEASHNE